MITVKTHISFKDFLIFHLKSSLIRLIAFPLLILLFFIVKLFADGNSEQEILLSASMWLGIMFLFFVIRSFLRLRFVFSSNKKIQENITYIFTEEKIRTEGETFDAEFAWNTVYKVKENKEWFLIYQSAQTMNMVPKKYFTKEQITGLRRMITENNVKAKLRKE
ncbi:YcxB family protein [Chryseobacterium gambrini]|uniref:YcxB family protein n=1 Tax=Chryseobacterium gambrini TaxID=373672 RepID=A0AAJ1VM53_9FLAO|nr:MULTISPECIES: YcxB family protein [Chryseobacterium]MDN4014511.1 YcxB family protein [Chryseobacterium gambrini]MDN4031513.1 YcxB family protein [Chryseobacterium gambrini]QWA38415.1 YcxB family protein [Chryseobacterium sp. ZHDP1]